MRSTLRRTKLAAALVGVTAAATIGAPVAYAMPADPLSPAATRDACDESPPPSLMAASAAEEYEVLRAACAQENSAKVASAPVAVKPSAPVGFDWVSAAIGAAAVAGLSLVSMATLGMRRHGGRRAASA
jgi:hypothetical protein